MSSLGRELALWLGVGLSASLGLGGWLMLRSVRDGGREEFDRASLAHAQTLASLLEHDGEYVEFEGLGDRLPEAYRRERDPEFFSLWLEEGPHIASAPAQGEHRLDRVCGSLDAPECWDLRLPDGRAGRALGVRIDVLPDDAVEADEEMPVVAQLVVARSREPLDQLDATVWRAMGLSGAGLSIAISLVVLLCVRRLRRRVRDLTEQLDRVDGGALDARIATPGLVQELRPLADTLNQLLDRLEASFARERRVNSSIAHEMRTPVAELRSAVEVAQRWPDDPELTQRALDAAAEVSLRMSSTIHALLRLTRLRDGGQSFETEDLDFSQVVRATAARLREQHPGSGRELRLQGSGRVVIQADPTLVEFLVRNLLENALEHGSDAGPIESELSAAEGCEWRLRNPCEGLATADLEHLTEPFWQKDEARSGGGHAGLGLSLARSICEAMGWSLHFRLQGNVFEVRLRLAPGAGP